MSYNLYLLDGACPAFGEDHFNVAFYSWPVFVCLRKFSGTAFIGRYSSFTVLEADVPFVLAMKSPSLQATASTSRLCPSLSKNFKRLVLN